MLFPCWCSRLCMCCCRAAVGGGAYHRDIVRQAGLVEGDVLGSYAVRVGEAGHVGRIGPVARGRVSHADLTDSFVLHHDDNEMIKIRAQWRRVCGLMKPPSPPKGNFPTAQTVPPLV